jgi:sulfite reductase (NADPH) flavoprotein alpha-component
LNNQDLLVPQYSGGIISETNHPFTAFLSHWSLQLHTGKANFLWSIILLIASASILFFLFSGLAMYIKRRIKTKTIPCALDKDDCEIIILIGSEGGHTYAFGKALFLQLSQQGKKVFLSNLNEYTRYQKATQLLICTSTYGDGSAPSNAQHFLENYKTIKQPKLLKFAVLGFGSLDYPHFCRFAIQVDAVLHQQENFIPLLPLEKIRSRSGDIIHILTPGAQRNLTYSIAKIGSEILLSIKRQLWSLLFVLK